MSQENKEEKYDFYQIGVQYADDHLVDYMTRLRSYYKNFGPQAARQFMLGVIAAAPQYSKMELIELDELPLLGAVDGTVVVERDPARHHPLQNKTK